MTEQQEAFWDLVSVFDELGLLPYVMLVGSWAEYIYQFHFKTVFMANLRTRDTDFLYVNINKPQDKQIDILPKLKEKGFLHTSDYNSGISKFVKEDLLELSFLTRSFGDGGRNVYDIRSLKLKAEGLRSVNMLVDYPMEIEYGKFTILVPEPEAYIIQKLLINPKRKPEYKKEKDMDGIRGLLPHVNTIRLYEIFKTCTKKQKATILKTMEEHFIVPDNFIKE